MAKAPPVISELRATLYSLMMVVFGIILSSIQLLMYPVIKFTDPTLFVYHRMNMFVTSVIIKLFVTVEVKGMEHLPPKTPVVIVCNHQSDVDTNVVSSALTQVNYKAMIKRELLFLPGIGLGFWLVGHVPVKRGNKEDGIRAMGVCADWLRKGVNIFFFPEGTRHITGETGPIGPLKPGAFKLAMEHGVPILPMTLSGARDVMPMKGFKLGFGTIRVTIHAPVQTANKSLDVLMEEVRGIMLKDMRDVDEVPYTPPSGASMRNVGEADREGNKKDR